MNNLPSGKMIFKVLAIMLMINAVGILWVVLSSYVLLWLFAHFNIH